MSDLQVLVNDQEIAEHLSRARLTKYLAYHQISWNKTDAYVASWQQQKKDNGSWNFDFVQFHSAIQQDLNAWQDEIRTLYKKHFRPLVNFLHPRLAELNMDRKLMELVQHSKNFGMIQTLGQRLSKNSKLITARQNQDSSKPVLIRNIILNEEILRQRISGNQPFWFLDTGYTNHLHDKKLWHRIVANHVHDIPDLTRSWPSDRLRTLPSFPRPWHGKGSRILIVENSPSHYRLYGDDIQAWRTRIAQELDQYDNTMEREWYAKNNKKERVSVYRYLEQDPKSWYCVITDCSAAAIEAIWLGIPVITLRRHITAPVARDTISRLHDLYRGSMGDWLCALTYSQFTVAELRDGTAHKILRRYHGA